MKKSFLIPAALILVASLLVLTEKEKITPASERSHLKVGDVELEVEIADEVREQAQGLSQKPSPGENEGTLFVFGEPGFYDFWMKGMKFGIDIIWIDEEMKIAQITPDVFPASFPKTFSSALPAKYVLEVNAGFSEKHNLKPGDRVYFVQ